MEENFFAMSLKEKINCSWVKNLIYRQKTGTDDIALKSSDLQSRILTIEIILEVERSDLLIFHTEDHMILHDGNLPLSDGWGHELPREAHP